MEFRSLNKSTLQEYVESPNFGKDEEIPISFHRAISHINNPRINATDTLLILAEENGELLGYLGLLPELFFPENGPIIKIGYISCFWVSAKSRGKGLSQQLISMAHFTYRGYIMLSDYVPATKKIYEKTGFFAELPLHKKGIRLYLKSDFQTLLPPKKLLFKKNIPALKLVDSSLNSLFNARQKALNFPLTDLTVETVKEVDEEIEQLILEKGGKNYFQRKKRELNWIVKFPWILSAHEKDEINRKYYFTSTEKSFENKLIKLKNKEGELVSFFFFTIKNGSIKLPYFYTNSDVKYSIIALNHLLQAWNAKTFTTYHPKLVAVLKTGKTPAFHKKEIRRNFLIDKQLSKLITHVNLFVQDGDGDAAFT